MFLVGLLGDKVLGLLQASVIPSEKWVPEVPSAPNILEASCPGFSFSEHMLSA